MFFFRFFQFNDIDDSVKNTLESKLTPINNYVFMYIYIHICVGCPLFSRITPHFSRIGVLTGQTFSYLTYNALPSEKTCLNPFEPNLL